MNKDKSPRLRSLTYKMHIAFFLLLSDEPLNYARECTFVFTLLLFYPKQSPHPEGISLALIYFLFTVLK